MKELEVAIKAAKSAGGMLREEYQKNHIGQLKADNTWVSEIDIAAEKIVTEAIRKNFPDHAIFSEEAGLAKTQSEYLWVIDPLDGSTNFLQHLGHFCTPIALVKNNQPALGVIYIPLTDELFVGTPSRPTTLNDQPIRTSDSAEAKHALIGWGRSSISHDRHANLYRELTKHVRSLRFLGSITINGAYTACGRFDASLTSDCKLYDTLAAAIIAEAAGAKVTDFSGNPWQPDFSDPTSTSDVLISNSHIHSDLVDVLQSA